METWLVTGSSGFLGSNVGIALQARARLVGLVRPGGSIGCGFRQMLQCDLGDLAELRNAVLDLAPDVILHAGALSGHEACERDPNLAYLVNTRSTEVLAQAAASLGSKLIYVSTDAVFDGSVGHYSEADEPNPFSVYGRTKLSGERAALVAPRHLVVRTNFFGWSPSGHASVLEFFLNRLRSDASVVGYSDFVVSSTYVQSLIEVIERLHACDARGFVHVASADAMSKYEFGRLVAQTFGFDPDRVTGGSASLDGHPTARRDISLDTSRVAQLLGAQMPTQSDGLARAMSEWKTVRAALDQTWD